MARGFRMRLNRLPRATTKNHAFQPGRQVPADRKSSELVPSDPDAQNAIKRVAKALGGR
jgi:hypothetical protein